ncbi:MAG TPA: hypothetical protein VEK15_32075, partial [Vicinamibacteria bacterium]|nr:hypothetical protein [Vicinamibacteria bacterium]
AVQAEMQDRSPRKLGIGAGLGTVLGAVVGGKKGAVIGAVVGAGGSVLATEGNETRFIQAHLPGPDGEPVGRGVPDPETIDEMWRPHASQMGQDIWGLGTILSTSNNGGGFVVGHDGNNEPAINTAARFNPRTGNGIVMLETGNPLLATEIAGEWVFWETGNVDFLTLTISAPRMFRTVAYGGLVILLAGLLAAWRLRRAARLATARA